MSRQGAGRELEGSLNGAGRELAGSSQGELAGSLMRTNIVDSKILLEVYRKLIRKSKLTQLELPLGPLPRICLRCLNA